MCAPHSVADSVRALRMTLKKMDDDSPDGLRNFFDHLNKRDCGNKAKLTEEVGITYGLAEELFAVGVPSFSEVRYPNHAAKEIGKANSRCDLVVGLGERRFLWIEAKLCYSIFWEPGFETEQDRIDPSDVQDKLGSRLANWEPGHSDERGESWPSHVQQAPQGVRFFTRFWFWYRETT